MSINFVKKEIIQSAFPPLPKEDNSNKCQYVYWNLLCCLEAGVPGDLFVHELKHTVGCDNFHDLSQVRNSVEKELKSENLVQVLQFSTDPMVLKQADIAVAHYNKWAGDEIYKGLSFAGKVYYQTYFRWDKWASGIAMFGGTVGGMFKVYRRLATKK